MIKLGTERRTYHRDTVLSIRNKDVLIRGHLKLCKPLPHLTVLDKRGSKHFEFYTSSAPIHFYTASTMNAVSKVFTIVNRLERSTAQRVQ